MSLLFRGSQRAVAGNAPRSTTRKTQTRRRHESAAAMPAHVRMLRLVLMSRSRVLLTGLTRQRLALAPRGLVLTLSLVKPTSRNSPQEWRRFARGRETHRSCSLVGTTPGTCSKALTRRPRRHKTTAKMKLRIGRSASAAKSGASLAYVLRRIQSLGQ